MKKLLICCFLFTALECFQRKEVSDELIGKEFYLVQGNTSLCKVRVEGCFNHGIGKLMNVIKKIESGDASSVALRKTFEQNQNSWQSTFKQKVFYLKDAILYYHSWYVRNWFSPLGSDSSASLPVYYGVICDTEEYKNFHVERALRQYGVTNYKVTDPIGCYICFNEQWLEEKT